MVGAETGVKWKCRRDLSVISIHYYFYLDSYHISLAIFFCLICSNSSNTPKLKYDFQIDQFNIYLSLRPGCCHGGSLIQNEENENQEKTMLATNCGHNSQTLPSYASLDLHQFIGANLV